MHSRNASGVGAINTNNLTSHSRNNSAGPAVVSTQNDGGNGSTVTVVTPESGPNIVVTNIVTGSTSQDDLLVQQTLQSLEDATSSGGHDNPAQDTQDDDEYPMETPL